MQPIKRWYSPLSKLWGKIIELFNSLIINMDQANISRWFSFLFFFGGVGQDLEVTVFTGIP